MEPERNFVGQSQGDGPSAEQPNAQAGRKRAPSKLDAVAQAKICAVIALGGTIEMAAGLVRCTGRAIRYAAKRDPEFLANILQSKENTALHGMNKLREAADADPKYWRAGYYHSKLAYPERFNRPANTVPVKQVKKLIDKAIEEVVDKTLGVIDSIVTDQPTHEKIGRRLNKVLGNGRRRKRR